MSNFMRTDNGHYINLQEVSRLQNVTGELGVEQLLAITKDGDRFRCAGRASVAERKLWPMLPAQPGFVLLSVNLRHDPTIPDDLHGFVVREPIIGWRISGDPSCGCWPITIEDDVVFGDEDFGSTVFYGIQCPDGRVSILDEYTVNTLDEFLDHIRLRWQQHRNSKAETDAAA